ncbi:cellulase family glycosylhydrolase [Candidatus Parcubacteria bacterium]|nr:cellulase family glycosylhydrolase [Candidatus Parcubacteria bacterium]
MRRLVRWLFRLVILALLLLGVVVGVAWWQVREVPDNRDVRYGVTFSPKRAADLYGLDVRRAYLAILDDLGARRLRLAAYWDRVETEKDAFSWDELDFFIREAEARNVSVLLAVGMRLPGWPECHLPGWTNSLAAEKRNEELLDYIKEVVQRYRGSRAIWGWQVENEPFLFGFGECPWLDAGLLDREIALVRELDDRAIVITDSGELGRWVRAAKRSDVFGTTMYRTVWDRRIGYVHYPMGPVFFRIKAWMVKTFLRTKRIIVVELQGEPWGPKQNHELSFEEMAKSMDAEKFRAIVRFERDTGFDEVYFWGAEWWYWLKTKYGQPEMWEEAKKLFAAAAR